MRSLIRTHLLLVTLAAVSACGSGSGGSAGDDSSAATGEPRVLIVADLSGSLSSEQRTQIPSLVVQYLRNRAEPGTTFDVYLLTSGMAGERPLLSGRIPQMMTSTEEFDGHRAFRKYADSLAMAIAQLLPVQKKHPLSVSCYIKSAAFAHAFFANASTKTLLYLGDMVEQCPDTAYARYDMTRHNPTLLADRMPARDWLRGICITALILPRDVQSLAAAVDPLIVEGSWRAIFPRLGADSTAVVLGTPSRLRLEAKPANGDASPTHCD
jgi:hypothetical protein